MREKRMITDSFSRYINDTPAPYTFMNIIDIVRASESPLCHICVNKLITLIDLNIKFYYSIISRAEKR